MKKKDKDKLRNILLDERAKIIQHLFRVEEASEGALSELKGDDVDLASIEYSQAALTKLGSREQKYLKKIEYALSKFDDDTYGICELTGEPIPVERLLARPVARYTVEAQTELERKERGYRDPDDIEDDELFPDSTDDKLD
ncbi:MAG TPA: TraR/DksA family transcriptional regulator [Oligoflexia bacterium]|nr:TraR/DksA family transcriptional regulator [Oligoflexia bacterium]HMP49101.1 TraR/DksA family transcriptional regulator [Oligoflexia bacterium]